MQDAHLEVTEVSAYTGSPEMMDGRVKTLHPKIHGGILCRRDFPEDVRQAEEQGIVLFDLVAVNLYPFEETVSRPGVSDPEAIEQIDIGGPSLIRAAAKNHRFVAIATAAEQYAAILEEVAAGGTTFELRRRLAAAAFARTAEYDQGIAQYFARTAERGADFPTTIPLMLRRKLELRYGENPHQRGALYSLPGVTGANLVTARQLNGKELSYNNLLDLDSALAIARSLSGNAAVVIKHNNPCAQRSPRRASGRHAAGDAGRRSGERVPVPVIGVNRPLDAATAKVLTESERFVEAIVAPGFEPEALEILTTRPKWKANVRLMDIGPLGDEQPGVAISSHRWRLARARWRCRGGSRGGVESGHPAQADRRSNGRSGVCLGCGPEREIQCNSPREKSHRARRRGGADEPGRLGRHRGSQGGPSGGRFGDGLRCVLSLWRFDSDCRACRGDGRHSAGRVAPRR